MITVLCPKCGQRNRLLDLPQPAKKFHCGKCGHALGYPSARVTRSEVAPDTRFLPRKRSLVLLIIVFLFLAALGIRLLYISEPTLDFHPARQYHSAIFARGLYLGSVESIPEWRREVASVNKQHEGIFEPPVMEYVVAFAYRIVGGEHLWIPRAMSSVFWLIGGAFLYMIARRMMSIDAAVISVAFYLLLPFTVAASSSFQPDPLMIMMLLCSVFMILRYHDNQSIPNLLAAAIVSAMAIFVKPVCVFVVFGAFVALAIQRQGIRKAVISPSLVIFSIVSFLPTFVYFLCGFVIDDFLRGTERSRFMPELFLHADFWTKWLNLIYGVLVFATILLTVLAVVLIIRRQMPKPLMAVLFAGWIAIGITYIVTHQTYLIGSAFGFTSLIVAILGVVLYKDRSSRALMIGLWAGYAVFGFVYTYHIHTHDYYHMQLIPIIALSLGPILEVGMSRLAVMTSQTRWRVVAWCAIVLVVIIIAIQALPTPSSKSYFHTQVRIAQEIGEYVGHSTNTAFLAVGYGRPLRYYGELYGVNWPHGYDFYQYSLEGRPELDAEQRLKAVLRSSPDYFIVTDLGEFNRQEDLKKLLTSEFPALVDNDEYLIFDLREKVRLEGWLGEEWSPCEAE